MAHKRVGQVFFDPRDFVCVRSHLREIDDIRPGEQIARLKEMNVRIDVSRQNKFALAIDDPGVFRRAERLGSAG